jgi:hypothetical protein
MMPQPSAQVSPHTMGNNAYAWLCVILSGSQAVSHPSPQRICWFCFLGEKILHETMNMHLYYELPLLTPLLTPHNPPPFPDVSDNASLPVFMAWVIIIANMQKRKGGKAMVRGT